jgi:hypothetical protein
MVVRVKLDARERWYVYPRRGGDPLIKGFDGSGADVLKKLDEPEFATYNRPRLRKRLAASFPIETLDGFIHRYNDRPRSGTTVPAKCLTRRIDRLTFAGTGQKGYGNQYRGRGGTGRRKGLKIPRTL